MILALQLSAMKQQASGVLVRYKPTGNALRGREGGRERDGEREREREGGRERKGERGRERERGREGERKKERGKERERENKTQYYQTFIYSIVQ